MTILYCDLAIVGCTRAGLATAEAARERGMSTCIIDNATQRFNHDLLWQRLLSESRVAFNRAAPLEVGLKQLASSVQRSWTEVAAIARERLASRIVRSCQGNGFAEIISGQPTIRSGQLVELDDGTRVHAAAVVVATGSRPRHPDRFHCDGKTVIDSVQLLQLGKAPRSVCIVGADWLGCEWAFVCASAGANVTLIDRRSRLLRAFDLDIRLILQERLHELGVEVVLGEEILEISRQAHGAASIRLASGRTEVTEAVLLNAGDQANTAGLGLAECGCELGLHGHVRVGKGLESSVTNLYCVGSASDATGFGSSDSLQAHLVVSRLAGESAADSLPTTPLILRCAEESATCGLTAEACSILDIPASVGTARMTSTGDGRVRIAKVVVESVSSRLVGVQLLGPGSSESACLAAHLVDHKVDQRLCASLSGCDGTMTETICHALRSSLLDSSPLDAV